MHDQIITLENCIRDIKTWMMKNFLKLNDDKTEFLLIGSKCNINKTSSLNVNNVAISNFF